MRRSEETSRKDVSNTSGYGTGYGYRDGGLHPHVLLTVSPTQPSGVPFVLQESLGLKSVTIIKIVHLCFGKYKLFLSLNGISIVRLSVRMSTPKSTKLENGYDD